MGDPAGIGPEIAVRALADPRTYEVCRPLVVGDGSVMQDTLDEMQIELDVRCIRDTADAVFHSGQIDVIDLRNVDLRSLKKAQVDAMAGAAAYEYIIRATDLALAGRVQAVVTGPINKDALNQAGYHFPGHTEILAQRTGTSDYAMMLVADRLRVVLVTIHVALREAIAQINEERILRAIRLAHQAGPLLGIAQPRVAVAALNPHASEGGLFGSEETEIIAPAIKKAQAMGYCVQGPLPADTVFYRALQGHFDIVTPMYHDQGLIPIKLIGFGRGVNVTLGLPIIRTSVDHGTAFGKAWQFRADAGSLMEAIRLAASMARAKTNQMD